MKKKLTEYIESELIGGEGETTLQPGDDLLGGGIVDSLGIMKLVNFVEEETGFSIPPEDMVIENFLSVDAISGYIKNRQNG